MTDQPDETEALRAQVRHLQAQLDERDAILRVIIDETPGGAVVVFDEDLRYRFVGGRGLGDVALDAEAMQGRTIDEVFDADTAAVIRQPYLDALAGTAARLEMAYADRLYQVDHHPIPLPEGGPLALAITRDLTALRGMSAQRDRLRIHNRVILDQFPGAIFLFDPEHRYVEVGGRALTDAGWDTDAMIGQRPEDLLEPEAAADLRALLDQALRDGISEADIPWVGGRTFSVRWHAVPGPDGQQLVLAVALDVTLERRDSERRARQLAQTEALLREVHHRVKNNLQVVRSLLSITARRVDDGVASQILLEVAQRVRAMATVHERLYAQPDLARVRVDQLVRALVQDQVLARPELETTAVELRTQAVEGTPDQGLEVGLVVVELLTNAARHALAHGGERVEVRLARDGDDVTLEIDDDGPGLPDTVDLDTTTSTGLWLVRSTVLRRGGTVDLAAGPGAHWRIRLPWTDPDA